MMLKALVVIAAVAIAMSVVGWLSFSNSSHQTTITFDKQQVRKDMNKAAEKVQEFSEDLQEQNDKSLSDRPTPDPTHPEPAPNEPTLVP